jgi:hypothetical protein
VAAASWTVGAIGSSPGSEAPAAEILARPTRLIDVNDIVIRASHYNPLTKSQSLARARKPPNPLRIRSSAKCANNPFVSRTSEIKDLKSFRIRTYEKKAEGGIPQ